MATNAQQIGIQYTSAGKAGFITALYIVFVPIIGIFLKKKMQLECLGQRSDRSYRILSFYVSKMD